MKRGAPPMPPLGQVRLIGGRWRGSKLPVAAIPGLRPTADRVRETLFNWLQAEVAGEQVLDLFAGSGALGFEAASRGAARVDLVEASPPAATLLRETAERLVGGDDSVDVRVHAQSALAFLAAAPAEQHWGLVFVDPPFADGLWDTCLANLAPRLATRAWVYVESPPAISLVIPPGWHLHRERITRDARAALYRVGAA